MARKARATEVERFIERLPVRLTIEEIAAYADVAARTRAEADLREADRGLRNKLEREAIEELEADMREHLRKVREKREDRDVECEERMLFASNTVSVVRLDTGEIVRERAMTIDERQEQLFAIDRGGEGAAS